MYWWLFWIRTLQAFGSLVDCLDIGKILRSYRSRDRSPLRCGVPTPCRSPRQEFPREYRPRGVPAPFERKSRSQRSRPGSGPGGAHRTQGVVFLGEFRDGVCPFIHRPALPVTVLVGFHFLEAGVSTNGLVHDCPFSELLPPSDYVNRRTLAWRHKSPV